MKKLLFIAVIFLTACGPQRFLTEQEEATIPKDATKIIAASPLPAGDYFQKIVGIVLTDGWRIETADKDLMFLNTGEYKVGNYECWMRMSISVIQDSLKSVATISTQWKFNLYHPAIWKDSQSGHSGQPNLSFTTALRLCQKFSNDITYK
jgi:hypothetical protein